MIIYHITEQDQWLIFSSDSNYLPVGFQSDGFIHCSTDQQVLPVAARYYAKSQNLLLLKIDTDLLSAPVKYENLEGGLENFPHIYGPLNKNAIIGLEIFEKDETGCFVFPDFP